MNNVVQMQEAPPLKWTKCNSITKVRKWDETYLRYMFFMLMTEFGM